MGFLQLQNSFIHFYFYNVTKILNYNQIYWFQCDVF